MSETQPNETKGEMENSAQQLADQLNLSSPAIEKTAIKDPLTGLYDRTYFQNTISKEAIKAHRYHRPISLIIFSLDHFKRINQHFGQPDCQQLLKQVGSAIKRNIREADSASCYWDGIFAIVLPETNLEGAMQLADRLREYIEKLQVRNDKGTSFGVTISAGVSTWDRLLKTDSKSGLISAACKALYQAKEQGRNRVACFLRPS